MANRTNVAVSDSAFDVILESIKSVTETTLIGNISATDLLDLLAQISQEGQNNTSGPNLPNSTEDKAQQSASDNLTTSSHPPSNDLATSLPSVVGLSILFFTIVVVGILGNCLVIIVILTDLKMRQSVTNLLIINLAVADLVIMLFGIPEIIMFMMNRGWLLGPVACKFNRFVLVVALYSSVISLVVLCIERFIGIVFPLRGLELCTRKKIVAVIMGIWPFAVLCGFPVAAYNSVIPAVPGIELCRLIFPGENKRGSFLIYRYIESVVFYFLPMVIQMVLYSMIAKRLYASNEELSTRFQMRSASNRRHDSAHDTIKARRGVVKMLIASVILYFISYSPTQIHLIYSTFASSAFFESWDFFVFVMIITHINSAANPVLYGIFSQNFRRNFKRCLCTCCACRRDIYKGTRFDSQDSRLMSMRSSTAGRTYVSKV